MSYPHIVMRAPAFSVIVLGLFAVGMATQSASAAETSAAQPLGSADESLVSERLSSRALAVLDGMFGPGRAKVLVEVRGERLQIRTETEIVTPINQEYSQDGVKEALRLLELPGYQADSLAPAAAKAALAAPRTIQHFQKDFEHSLRDAGFEIKKIEATVVLDSALTDDSARAAAQILPQLLRIDAARGDVLSIVRAPLRPAWKTAFATPGDWRKFAFAASGLLAVLIIGMIIASAFVRGARAFAKELTTRRNFPGSLGGEADSMGEPLPELMPGSPAQLVEAGLGGESREAPIAALGRRFDFLETADAAGAARILAEETPADLAQVFADLAKLAPETASRLFSKLPADVQAEASAVLLKLRSVDPDRLSEIEERLRVLVANGLRGSERLATILSRFPRDERAMLLSRLASREPTLGREDSCSVEEIESLLFSFDLAAKGQVKRDPSATEETP